MLYSMLCLKQRRAFRNSKKADGYQIPSNPVSPERHLDFPKILLLILNIINVLLRNRDVFVLLRTVFSLNAKFHCCKHLITIFMFKIIVCNNVQSIGVKITPVQCAYHVALQGNKTFHANSFWTLQSPPQPLYKRC